MERSIIEQIKKKVSIPNYFYRVILPEMPDYYNDYPVNFEARPVVKCPIHGEDTPSLRWYEETNTFYCFGCRAGGDVIELHTKFMGVVNGEEPSFEEAVQYLYSKFVKGKEDAPSTTPQQSQLTKTEEVELSTTAEMIRLGSMIVEVEQMLAIDTHLTQEFKQRIYKVIDEVHLLVGLNKVSATEGMKYIHSALREVV